MGSPYNWFSLSAALDRWFLDFKGDEMWAFKLGVVSLIEKGDFEEEIFTQ